MNINIDKQSLRLLYLLLLADAAFILIHFFYMMDLLPSKFFSDLSGSLFSIEQDFGYAEVYQYIKEFWIVLLLIMLAVKSKKLIYFSWSTLFLYFLLDDSLRIHEKLGRHIALYFGFQPMFDLRARDLGELCVFIAIGILLFSITGASYWFSDRPTRKISTRLFILIVILSFFGVFVDMLHMSIGWGKSIWGLLEDGGEMIVMSVILCYVFNLGANNAGVADSDRHA